MVNLVKQKPLISVIMPVYNDVDRLERCLKSLEAQTLKNLEFLIINDGSNDGSGEMLNKFAKKDSRFIVLEANSIGPYGCRNIGLKAARGDYIGFIDSDDWVKPNAFEKLVEPFFNSDVDSTFCSTTRFDESTDQFSKHYDFSDWPKIFDFSPQTIHRINGAIWNKLYKKKNLTALGLTFSEYRMSSDIHFNWVYFFNYPKVSVVAESLYIYTIRNGSIVTRAHGFKSLDMIQVLRDMKNYLKSQNAFEQYKDSFYDLAVRSVGPRFIREKTMKLPFLAMTLIWLGPGIFIWGLSHFKEVLKKIKRY